MLLVPHGDPYLSLNIAKLCRACGGRWIWVLGFVYNWLCQLLAVEVRAFAQSALLRGFSDFTMVQVQVQLDTRRCHLEVTVTVHEEKLNRHREKTV